MLAHEAPVGARVLVVIVARLVADDDADTVASLTILLRDQGYKVRGVHRGAEVLQAVFDFAPDVVLLDIGMPQMSGYDVARAFRDDATLGDVLLVALTGYGSDKDRAIAEQAGFDAYLVKPVDIDRLGTLILAHAVSHGHS